MGSLVRISLGATFLLGPAIWTLPVIQMLNGGSGGSHGAHGLVHGSWQLVTALRRFDYHFWVDQLFSERGTSKLIGLWYTMIKNKK
jgi:hypothetical protein